MKREYSLDLARLVAAYLVLFGHYALSGTFDETSRTWIGNAESLPLLSQSAHILWIPDIFLLGKWQTATAIWGVALFFLISGWVVPPMLARYSRGQFLVNRFFRIFPLLIVAVSIAAAIQFQFGDRFSLNAMNVLSTMTLTTQFTGHPLTLGVVWTLVIEFKFYLLIALVGRIGSGKILLIVTTMLALLLLQTSLVKYGMYSSFPRLLNIINAFIHDFCFMIFMLCGSAMWLIVKAPHSRFRAVATLLFTLLACNVYRYISIHQLEIHFYQDINIVTQAITGLFFSLCLLAEKILPNENIVTRTVCKASDVTYSLYLLHVSLGFFLLSRLRHIIENQYLLLLAVTLTVTLIAAVSYRFIELPGNRLGKQLIRYYSQKNEYI